MYQNYHRHSHYSNIILTDSVAFNEDYAKRAAELGHSVLSSCEHGTPGNYREVADLASKYGLKWRYVAEPYFVIDRQAEDPEGKKDRHNCHLIVAAKTAKGVGDLNFALSEASISGYYFRPRLDMELLLSLDPRDVFLTTACVGGVWTYGRTKNEDGTFSFDFTEPDRIVRQLHSHFRDSFALEVQYHDDPQQKAINAHILDLYRTWGIPIIAGMDSHYIYPEEKELRRMRLEANHIVYEDEGRWYMDYPSDDTARQRFLEQGVLSSSQIDEALDNTNIFLDFEDVVFDKSRKLPTLYPQLTQEQRNEKYRELVTSKWEEFKKNVPQDRWPEYEEGIRYEVDTITSTNTSDYFLLDYEWIRHAREMGGVLTKTGRGSAPSYFTNMLLGFSSIDRFALPITMYPDRFISADRLKSGSLPDIDMNVSDQALFGQAMADVMGEWRSAPMVAYGTLKRASAWKMYCRAANVPFETANALSDRLKQYELDYKHADEEERESLNVYEYVPPEYREQLSMSERYLGMIDSISPHPCAYLLCQGDIRREVGIFRLNSKTGKKKVVYAAFIDGATADAYGYLKNDDLAVDVVKVNADIYKRIGIPQPSVSQLLEMTKNDKATWDMYAKGYTLGLNQAEREKSTEKVMRYKPRNISELSAFVAGIRPAFQSMLPKLLDREKFSYGIPALDKLLQTPELPQSFILYQEQMMKVLQWAGFTSPESYAAIKAIAKKHPEKVLPLRERFMLGFSQRLVDEEGIDPIVATETTEKVWTIISDACGYGFNSSHATAVALDSLYTAWAKAHYPYETYVALMSNYSEKGDKDRITKAKEEMKKAFGIRVAPCRFRQDNRGYYVDKEAGTISDALPSVKHLTMRLANALYDMRDNTYDNFMDLLMDMELNPAFTTQTVSILIRMGYFEEFGPAGKLMAAYNEFHNGESRFSKSHVKATQEKRMDALRQIFKKLPDTELPVAEQMSFEVEHFGLPVSVRPDCRGYFAAVEVDDRYSPKVRLYNVAKGTMGVMKVRKPIFQKSPIRPGDVILLREWERKQAYTFKNGSPSAKPGAYDLWMKSYNVIPFISK